MGKTELPFTPQHVDIAMNGYHPAAPNRPGPPMETLSKTEFAKYGRKRMRLVDDIRATGAAAHVELPTICVIGNQSTGKSSLIEAVSNINLPRASGTCTRCPTEVRLQGTPGAAWQCKVKLRRETDESGKAWTGTKEVEFGRAITQPAEVEAVVRRAQLAILNPSVDYKRFVDYDLPAEPEALPLGSIKQLSFSKNVICLEISGPDVADLTLIDLPGLIKAVGEGEDQNNIALIEDLVKENISKDCLILLTITMRDDFNNQSAVMLAKEYDSDGKRTIGVLTKVDTVAACDSGDWLKMLKGEKERLHHGYYVTRQPPTDELQKGITFEEARKKEAAFFDTTQPWKDLDPAWRLRLGTKNLTAFLSTQLMHFINARLPHLISQINTTHEDVEDRLRRIPNPPSDDPAGEMLSLVASLRHEIQSYTQGSLRHKDLIQDLNKVYAKLKRDVRATAPMYTPFTRSEIRQDTTGLKSRGDSYFGLLNDPEQDTPGEKAAEDGGSWQKGAFDFDFPVPRKGRQAAVVQAHTARANSKSPFAELSTGKRGMHLDDMREKIEGAITRELPGNVPFDVKLGLIEDVIQPWTSIVLDSFDSIRPLVEKSVLKVVHNVFGAHEFTMLPMTINAQIKQELQRLSVITRLKLIEIVQLDEQPFTQNHHYLSDVAEKTFAGLCERRCPPVAADSTFDKKVLVNEVLSALAKLGYRCNEADLKKLNAPTEWEREIRVMAETRAYFQIAYKRIIDEIPRTIDANFIRPLAKTMHDSLLKSLAIHTMEGKERCRTFLAEDGNVTAQRSDLAQRKASLEAAKQAVHSFGLSTN